MTAPRILFDFSEYPLSHSGDFDSSVWNTDGVRSLEPHVYATGSVHSAMRRMVSLGGNQFSQVTVVSVLAASGALAGPMTRMQGPGDASGYLLTYRPATAQLILYLCVDGGGGPTFTQLGSAVDITIGASDAVRLTSDGDEHTIVLNGDDLVTITDPDDTYTEGYPGFWMFAAKNQIAVTAFGYGEVFGGFTGFAFTAANGRIDDNWENPAGAGGFTALSWQEGAAIPAIETYAAARYEGASIGDDQFAEITGATVAGSSFIGALTRMQPSTSAECYMGAMFGDTGGGTVVSIYKVTGIAGAPTFGSPLATATIATPAFPVSLWLESTGNSHIVRINGATIVSTTDSSYPSGQPGFGYAASVGNADTRKWSGGDQADRQPTVYMPAAIHSTVMGHPFFPGPDQPIDFPEMLVSTKLYPMAIKEIHRGFDDFGANEYPLRSGGLWNASVWNVPNGLRSVRGHIYPVQATTHSGMRRIAGIGADHYAECVLVCLLDTFSPFAGPATRMSAGSASGYALSYSALGGFLALFRFDDDGILDPEDIVALGANFPVTVTDQDVVGLASIGDEHRVYFNGVYLGSRFDSVYDDGDPGIWMYGSGNMCVCTEYRYGPATFEDITIHDDGTDFVLNLLTDIAGDSDWENGPGAFDVLAWERSCVVESIIAPGVGPPPAPDGHAAARRQDRLMPDQWSEILFYIPPDGSWCGVTTRMASNTNSEGYISVLFQNGDLRIFRMGGGPGTTSFGQAPGVPGREVARTNIGAFDTPTRMRLWSIGDTHSVYVNGVLKLIGHDDVAISGQPGMALFSNTGPNSGRIYEWQRGGEEIAVVEPAPFSGPLILAEIYLDSGVEYVSSTDVTHSSRVYSGRVLQWGMIDRSIPSPAGLPQASDGTIRLADTDGSLRALLVAQTPRRRVIKLKLVTAQTSEAAYDYFYSAEIVGFQLGPGYCEFSLSDQTLAWLDEEIPSLGTHDNFPDMATDTPEFFFPIITGTVENIAVQLPHIAYDVSYGDRYALARHSVWNVLRVWRYTIVNSSPIFFSGWVLVDPSEYTITEDPRTIDGVDYTLTYVDFDAEQAPGTTIGVDVDGIYSRAAFGSIDATPDDAVLRNPVDFFLNLVVLAFTHAGVAANFDTGRILEVRDVFEAASVFCDGAITEPISCRELLSRFLTCFNLDLFVTQAGLIALNYTDATDSGRDVYSYKDMIIRGTFKESMAGPTANQCNYLYARNYGGNEWFFRGTADIAADQTELGTVETETLEQWFIRDADVALAMAEKRLSFLSLSSYRQEFQLPLPEVAELLELGKLIGITHREGLATGGYTNKEAKVIGLTADLDKLTLTVRTILRVPTTI